MKLIYLISRIFLVWTFLIFLAHCALANFINRAQDVTFSCIHCTDSFVDRSFKSKTFVMAEVKKIVWLIIGLFLINLDFVSDLMVGLGLYNGCHYYFASVSFFFSSLPSILIFIFLTLTSIFPKIGDRMTNYVKEQSGLYPFHLLGLVFCFPLYNCVVKIMGHNGHVGIVGHKI